MYPYMKYGRKKGSHGRREKGTHGRREKGSHGHRESIELFKRDSQYILDYITK